MPNEDTHLVETNRSSDSKGGESTAIDREKAQRGVRLLLEAMGENPDRSELTETWKRRVPDVLETFSEGERLEDKPIMRTFDADSDGLIVKTGIPVYSLCEHHLLPYQGKAHVAYRPEDRVVGLSKLPRYVRWQSRRLTMQEQLTRDIADGLADEVDAETVLVEITATHMCEAMRGVETATETTTRTAVGSPTDTEQRRFRDAIQRAEDPI
jgi:GTP cyclohydrolase I